MLQSLPLRWLHIKNLYVFTQLYAFQYPRWNVKRQTTIYQKLSTFLHNPLFLVHFNSYEVIHSQSLKGSKSYQNNQVTSIKKLLGVPNSFLLYYEITWSDL